MSSLNDRQFPDPDDDDLGYMRHAPLFHGTDADLKPGDRIEPKVHGVAYATPRHDTARDFAEARKGLTGKPGRIYEVKPLADDHWAQEMPKSRFTTHEVASKTGFEVVGRVPKRLKPEVAAQYDERRSQAMEEWKQRTGRTTFDPDRRAWVRPE